MMNKPTKSDKELWSQMRYALNIPANVDDEMTAENIIAGCRHDESKKLKELIDINHGEFESILESIMAEECCCDAGYPENDEPCVVCQIIDACNIGIENCKKAKK